MTKSPSTSSTEAPLSSEPELLEVGRIGKPHGLRGEVIVSLLANRDERVAPGMVFHADGRDFVVEKSTPHQGRYIVEFEGVLSREDAEAIRNTVLFAAPLDDPDVDWVHDLIGADVIDQTGAVVGVVEAVQDNPVADLLVLESGPLIPMTFVVETAPGRVVVDIPEGLLDL